MLGGRFERPIFRLSVGCFNELSYPSLSGSEHQVENFVVEIARIRRQQHAQQVTASGIELDLPCAAENGYAVELAEPDSSWWQELRVLLKYKEFVADRLFDAWAQRLADSTRDTHRVPASTIRHWMRNWRHDLTVEQILKCEDA